MLQSLCCVLISAVAMNFSTSRCLDNAQKESEELGLGRFLHRIVIRCKSEADSDLWVLQHSLIRGTRRLAFSARHLVLGGVGTHGFTMDNVTC